MRRRPHRAVRAPDGPAASRSPGRTTATRTPCSATPTGATTPSPPTCCWSRPARSSCSAGSATSSGRRPTRPAPTTCGSADTGAWSILKTDTSGRLTTLASGTPRRAGHQQLAHAGAQLHRHHDHRQRRRHHGRLGRPTPPTPPARSASAWSATRPPSSTTCHHPREAGRRSPGHTRRGPPGDDPPGRVGHPQDHLHRPVLGRRGHRPRPAARRPGRLDGHRHHTDVLLEGHPGPLGHGELDRHRPHGRRHPRVRHLLAARHLRPRRRAALDVRQREDRSAASRRPPGPPT